MTSMSEGPEIPSANHRTGLTFDSEVSVGGHAHATLWLADTAVASSIALGGVLHVEVGHVAPRVDRLGFADPCLTTPHPLQICDISSQFASSVWATDQWLVLIYLEEEQQVALGTTVHRAVEGGSLSSIHLHTLNMEEVRCTHWSHTHTNTHVTHWWHHQKIPKKIQKISL